MIKNYDKILFASNLIPSEKLLLIAIIGHSDKYNCCYDENIELARLLGLSKKRVSAIITSLKRKDYINVELIYYERTNIIEKRKITVL